MKRPSTRTTVLAALACALPLGVLPAVADSTDSAAAPLGTQRQSVAGSIALPTRFTDGESGFPGLGRRVWLAASPANGVVAHVFDVDATTWGGAFEITEVTDATGAGDLDIYFYGGNFGDVSGQASPEALAQYAAKGKGGDSGFVPAGARKAVVYTANAVRSTFTYKGYSAPQVAIAAGAPLDLTVPAGATVVWVNRTGDYSFVRHLPATANGKKLFDSSPKVATGIPADGTFSHTFANKGTFAYETSAGRGTITVTDGPGVGTPAA